MIFNENAMIECFWQARCNGEYFPSKWADQLTVEQAYRIQLGLVARRVAAGERQVGWKVGLTAAPIQRQFGLHEPVFGCLMDDGLKRSRCRFGPTELINPGFETELCMRLAAPLTGSTDTARARRAIDICFPALEIVETRGNVGQIALALADNAQQKAFVLGEPVPLTEQLQTSQVEATVYRNGAEIARGRGEAVLDDPINSVVWLTGKLNQFGVGLRAGDLIMTGSFVRQFPLSPGDSVRAEFTGVGAVEAEIAPTRGRLTESAD